MMKLNDFISKLELALKEPSRYEKGGWGKWNGTSWGWDCVCLIKGILWGWDDDKSKPRGGGAVYGSNGVPDKDDSEIYALCKNKSIDFSKISVGELVHMQGHVGTCVKPPKQNELGYVIEATKITKMKISGVIKSSIDINGNRIVNGEIVKSWTGHGFLPYVDYSEEPTPSDKISLPSRGYFKKGDSGEDISKISDYMAQQVIGDYFGDYDEACVKVFQKQHGLEADGCIGPITLDAMRKAGFPY